MEDPDYIPPMKKPTIQNNITEDEIYTNFEEDSFFCKKITSAIHLCKCVFDIPEITHYSTEQESSLPTATDNAFNEPLPVRIEKVSGSSSSASEKDVDPIPESVQEINTTNSPCIGGIAEEFILSDNGHLDFQNLLRTQNEKKTEPASQNLVPHYDPKRIVKVVLNRLENELNHDYLSQLKKNSEQAAEIKQMKKFTHKKIPVRKRKPKIRLTFSSVRKCRVCKKNFPTFRRHRESECKANLPFQCKICFRDLKTPERLNDHILSTCDTEKVFSCDVCNRKYILKHHLIEHKRVCSSLRQYKCGECQKSFKTQKTLRKHASVHGKPNDKVLCEICGMLVGKRGAESHLNTHSNQRLHVCKTCGKEFKSKRALCFHNSNTHGLNAETKFYNCADCGKSFRKLSNLKLHMKVHGMMTSIKKTHCCKHCSKLFVLPSLLKDHERIHSGERPYVCNICKHAFRTRNHLRKHSIIHSQLKPHGCKICNKGFISKGQLEEHLRIHTGEKPFVCDVCGNTFRTRRQLRRHSIIHSVIKPHCCEVCNKCFSSKTKLEEHTRIHTGEKPCVCDVCGCSFRTLNLLKVHSIIHLDVKRHSCETCKKCFISENKLEEHLRIHTGEKPFVCDECGNTFRTRCQLRRHSIIHTDIKPHCCEICNKCFTSKTKLEDHTRIHTGEKPFVCVVCGNTFRTRRQLRRHSIIHTDIKPHCCEICNKCFTSKTKLEEHTRIHTGEKPCICDVCGQSFRTRKYLKSHCNVHSNVKPYCKICCKWFNSKSYLKQHMTIHTGEKPFVCNICEQTFRTNKALKRHFFIHSEVKPHYCSICNKSFTAKDKLIVHLRVHTGEKPYKCNICGRNFTSNHSLKKHKQTHSSKQIFSCEVCSKTFRTISYLRIHFRIHSGEQPNVCKHCGKGFLAKKGLTLHCQNCGVKPVMENENLNKSPDHENLGHSLIKNESDKSLPEKSEEYIYDTNTGFWSKALSKNHAVLHSDQKLSLNEYENSFSCLRTLNLDKETLNKQPPMHNTTSTNKLFTCAVCRAAFKTMDSLSSHMILHDTVSIPPNTHFNNNNNLHKDVQENYTLTGQLKQSLKCHICHKNFNAPHKLKKHYLTHSDFKPFNCELCHKSFKHNFSLRRHIDSSHRNTTFIDSVLVTSEIPSETDTADLKALHGLLFSDSNEDSYLYDNKQLWEASLHGVLMSDTDLSQLNIENKTCHLESVVKMENW